jgi:hypothetical protein
MHKLAYWLGPNGEERTLHFQSHIGDVIAHPDAFAVAPEWIAEVYRRHHEPLGVEGLARQEIVRVLLRRGWIRVRWQPEVWQVTCRELDDATRARLAAWAGRVLASGADDDPHRVLRVTAIGDPPTLATERQPAGRALDPGLRRGDDRGTGDSPTGNDAQPRAWPDAAAEGATEGEAEDGADGAADRIVDLGSIREVAATGPRVSSRPAGAASTA